jgi:hypothetical protein
MKRGLWVLWPLGNFLLVLMFCQAVTVGVEAQNLSSFDFPTFNSTDKLLTNDDSQYMPNSSSIWINPFLRRLLRRRKLHLR